MKTLRYVALAAALLALAVPSAPAQRPAVVQQYIYAVRVARAPGTAVNGATIFINGRQVGRTDRTGLLRHPLILGQRYDFYARYGGVQTPTVKNFVAGSKAVILVFPR